MATGIEITGLVLAVLPLFIETAKVYSHGVKSMHKLSSRRERDEKLQEFYGEFYWEVYQLDCQTRRVIESLPHLSDKRKAELTMDIRLEDWKPEADVALALSNFFGSKEDFDAFLYVMDRIAWLLSKLIKDPTIHISSDDVDQSKMFNKLKGFAADRASAQTSSTFKERLRFWKKEKERTTCLKYLATWNTRLLRLTEQAQQEPVTKITPSTGKCIPSSHLRVLSQKLYRALAKCWGCNCQERHEAKFCLKSHGGSISKPDIAEVDFDFLFSVMGDQKSGRGWQEGTVSIRPDNSSEMVERSLLGRICDAIGCRGPTNQCLQILVEDYGKSQIVWQLLSLPKRLPIFGATQAESLQTILGRSVKFPLATKRRLAVTFAHSLLQLHESYWLSKEWNKNHIFFFYGASGTLDFQRPYLSTVFTEDTAANKQSVDLSRFHRSPSILALGILLIEIHTERLIESFRTGAEQQEANGNTDWLVANRVVKRLEDCSLSYRDAIQACLDTPWIPAGQRVSLEDAATRAGLYQDVIEPLENELRFLFREKI
ncbi:MAG: hypothetical protein M1834_009571 [Cirrosporium novae-zelandiae]|nr:MAG: hypothetical protein M1834_009571 [Cirrosporium novae-zelandiae]